MTRSRTAAPDASGVPHPARAGGCADRHGYGIRRNWRSAPTAAVPVLSGHGDSTLRGMTEVGLVAEKEKAKGSSKGSNYADERRRYYRITPFGREVARAEARRLANLVQVARAKALLAEAIRSWNAPSVPGSGVPGFRGFGSGRRSFLRLFSASSRGFVFGMSPMPRGARLAGAARRSTRGTADTPSLPLGALSSPIAQSSPLRRR